MPRGFRIDLPGGSVDNPGIDSQRDIMNIVLKNQVHAAEQSALELEEELPRRHRWAMMCYNVQDLARSAVHLFSDIGNDVDRWQRDLADRKDQAGEESAELGSEWDGLYRSLARVFERTAGLVQKLENQGYCVDGKSEFLASWRELRGIVCFSHDRIALAAEQVHRGEVQSLGDIERELRDIPID
jgi:hypothetical protein